MRYLFFILFLLLPSSLFAEAQSLRVGAILPLSGDLAFVGLDIQRGMELAVSDASSEGFEINLIFEDSQYIQKTALTAAKKLIESDKVDVLVSLWDTADPIAPLTESKKIPHIAIRWDSAIGEEFKYTVAFESRYQSVVKEQLELMQRLGVKKLAQIGTEDKSFVLTMDEVAKTAESYGIQLVHDNRFPDVDSSFNSILLKTVQAEPDALIIWLFTPKLELAIRKVRSIKPELRLLGQFNDIPYADRGIVEGQPYVMMYNTPASFSERFEKKYGEKFSIRAPHAYDVIKLVGEAAQNSNKSSGAILKYLAEVSDYQGASGRVRALKSKKSGFPQALETEVVSVVFENGVVKPF